MPRPPPLAAAGGCWRSAAAGRRPLGRTQSSRALSALLFLCFYLGNLAPAAAYLDCKAWYGNWGNKSDTSVAATLLDNYWITVGPQPAVATAPLNSTQVKGLHTSWTHCGPANPDVINRCACMQLTLLRCH